MRQVLIRRGQVVVEQVPAPLIEPGYVLVEVAYSLISAGTEISSVESSGRSLLQRAIQQPDKVLQVVEHLRGRGIQKTIAKVKGQLDVGRPSGYSCAGVVLQVGEGVAGIFPGDWVACAGANYANHAEIVLVPRNLVVKVPDGCDLRSAASVTLGAIAIQGIRRADPRLGEIVAVIGLGLLGQLTVQLLQAAGCRVLGFDLDPRRVELALHSGAERAFVSFQVDGLNEVRHLSSDHGADAVIITAASQSDEIVQQAMQVARKKGKVVVVGAVGLGLKRSPFYEKELDFLISRSYGPGRYDSHYEEQGVDYPYAYVRWTENRNMAEYLRLVAQGKICLESILEQEYDIADAAIAYQNLQTAGEKPLGVLLRFPFDGPEAQQKKSATRFVLTQRAAKNKISLAVVGVGGFAKGVHLPNLRKLNHFFHICAVVSGTGSNAKETARLYDAEYASTSYADVLADPEIDAVLLCTRHHLHAAQTIAAAQAGKAIFVEKPMALTQTELEQLEEVLTRHDVPFMVGFNRRFSPAAQRAHALLSGRSGPLMMTYRVNAGYLPPEHWTHGPEGGGRIIGEACHMFDLFQYLSGSELAGITVTTMTPTIEYLSASDNIAATLRYVDGSVATLIYATVGAADFPKEYVEIHNDSKTFVIDDYRALRVYGTNVQGWQASNPDKGHVAELEAFAQYVRGECPAPIPLAQLVETHKLSLIAAGKS